MLPSVLESVGVGLKATAERSGSRDSDSKVWEVRVCIAGAGRQVKGLQLRPFGFPFRGQGIQGVLRDLEFVICVASRNNFLPLFHHPKPTTLLLVQPKPRTETPKSPELKSI